MQIYFIGTLSVCSSSSLWSRVRLQITSLAVCRNTQRCLEAGQARTNWITFPKIPLQHDKPTLAIMEHPFLKIWNNSRIIHVDMQVTFHSVRVSVVFGSGELRGQSQWMAGWLSSIWTHCSPGMSLVWRKGSTAKEICADAAGVTFQHLHVHRVKPPVVMPTQEVSIAWSKGEDQHASNSLSDG